MAFAFQGQVDPENEARTRGYYETVSEKDGRRSQCCKPGCRGMEE